MESEARNEINNDDYDAFFYATMCHVCKRFSGDGVQLKSCRGCKMISYCGKEHQKQHWKQHKPLCKAIQDVLRGDSMDYRGETTEEWTVKKRMFMYLVMYKLGRTLNAAEKQMFCFPRECLVCHERNLPLVSCQKCAVSFCQIHKNHIDHSNICAPLKLCLCVDFFFMRNNINYMYLHSYLSSLCDISCTSTFQNMKDFIKAFGNIQTDSEMSYNVQAAQHSDRLSCPLTLFYAVRLLNYVPKRKDLVIHVVGANNPDYYLPWLILPQLIDKSIVVIMTGLSNLVDPPLSRTVLFENKSLFFQYQNVSYEKYVCSPSFVKPDLIVGFNLRFHIEKYEIETDRNIWASSIHALAKQNCPFIVTFFRLNHFEKGMNKINTILGAEVNHPYSGKNPFASCLPCRDVYGSERVFNYNNQYIIIYQSLCS